MQRRTSVTDTTRGQIIIVIKRLLGTETPGQAFVLLNAETHNDLKVEVNLLFG